MVRKMVNPLSASVALIQKLVKAVKVKAQSNVIVDKTRPFTLRFDFSMFLIKEKDKQNFW